MDIKLHYDTVVDPVGYLLADKIVNRVLLLRTKIMLKQQTTLIGYVDDTADVVIDKHLENVI